MDHLKIALLVVVLILIYQNHIVVFVYFVCMKLLFLILHHYELYLFGKSADATMLYLKYPQTITHFIIDDDLINSLHHLDWSYDHLSRYIKTLSSTTNSLNFFSEKEIGDTKFQKSFPAFLKASSKLEDEIISASQRITDMAGLILKSGW